MGNTIITARITGVATTTHAWRICLIGMLSCVCVCVCVCVWVCVGVGVGDKKTHSGGGQAPHHCG